MVILNKELSSASLFKKAKNVVSKHRGRFENIEFVQSARVPIIKFFDTTCGFEFDVCFNEEGGLFAIEEIINAIRRYPEMKYLFLILKLCLRQRKFNSSYTGGIGSFLLFCMLLHFIRDHKIRLLHEHGVWALQNLTLSHLLLQFLHYYGIAFNYADQEIDVSKKPYVRQKQFKSNAFSLISPQDPSQNIGNACFKFYDIFKMFKNRYFFITSTEHDDGESILVHLINPCFAVFDRTESH